MRRAILVMLVGPLLMPGAASASAYSQVLQTYQATGSLPACRFSSAQLAAALRGIDAYGQQYFADFTDAVENALAARAAGACIPGAHPRFSALAPQAPLPPSPTSATDANLPLPLLVLAVLTLILAVGAGAGWLGRRLGSEPDWAAAWRHAWAEAGDRISGALADMADLADRRRRR